jgi:hypothetical protein
VFVVYRADRSRHARGCGDKREHTRATGSDRPLPGHAGQPKVACLLSQLTAALGFELAALSPGAVNLAGRVPAAECDDCRDERKYERADRGDDLQHEDDDDDGGDHGKNCSHRADYRTRFDREPSQTVFLSEGALRSPMAALHPSRDRGSPARNRISHERSERLQQLVERGAQEPVSPAKKPPARPVENELDPTR